MTSTGRKPPLAATHIALAAGDLGRPGGGIEPNGDLGHLPGRSGIIAGIVNLLGWTRRGNAHLLAQMKKFGPVYRQSFVRWPVVCVADPELVLSIVRNEDQVWSAALAWRLFFEGLDANASTLDSTGTLDFEPHKDARQLLTPAFSAPALSSYLATAVPMFERAADDWLRRGRVSFKREARRLFASVASKIFTGEEDPVQATILDRALADFWKAPTALTKSRFWSPTWRRATDGYRTLWNIFRPQVARRRIDGGEDLFSRLCKTAAQVPWIDDDVLVRLFLGVMPAAFDTTALGVTSMAYRLATRPEWQDRLYAEGERLAPDPITYESIRALEQHDWVWKETLRLDPVAPDLPRIALHEVVLDRHRIPAGALVLAMIGPLLGAPTLWKDPDQFDPDRFSPRRVEDKASRGAFLPFGGGAHACLGAQLSTLESKAFWRTLLVRARIRLARPYRAHHQFTMLGAVSGDVELVLERR